MEPSSGDSQQGGLGKGQLCHTASQEPYITFLILPRRQGLHEPLLPQVPGLLDQGFSSLYFDLGFCFVFLKQGFSRAHTGLESTTVAFPGLTDQHVWALAAFEHLEIVTQNSSRRVCDGCNLGLEFTEL